MDLDVVIVGAGIQGLVLLRELTAHGYACVLVTDAALGAGQTLHSHGALASGVALVTGGLHEALHGLTVPYLRRLGVAVHAEASAFLVIPDPMLEAIAPVWRANGYQPDRCDPSALPAGFEPAATTYRVSGCNVDVRQLVGQLGSGFEAQMLSGRVVAADRGLQVRVDAGYDVHLNPRAVVVAAGCGTKRLLQGVFGIHGGALDRVTYSRLHMVCLTAPEGVLPAISGVVSPELLVIGHRRQRVGAPAGDVWYVTPADPSASPHVEAPDDAEADVEPRLVAGAADALMRVFPALRREGAQVRAAVFAGYKQDIEGDPTRRLCELVDSDRNLVVVLPSVMANALPNALECVGLLRSRFEPSRCAALAPQQSRRVPIGEPREDRGLPWCDWPSFARTYVS